jgi:ABC-type multidrug transport system fused ATPase/permease subunit
MIEAMICPSAIASMNLITRNTNDVQQVQMLAMMGATMLVTAPLLAIGGIIMALQQDVGLSWLIAVAVPVLLVIAGFIISRMVPLFRQYQNKLDGVNRVMREHQMTPTTVTLSTSMASGNMMTNREPTLRPTIMMSASCASS